MPSPNTPPNAVPLTRHTPETAYESQQVKIDDLMRQVRASLIAHQAVDYGKDFAHAGVLSGVGAKLEEIVAKLDEATLDAELAAAGE